MRPRAMGKAIRAAVILALLAGCGERPQRIGKGEPASPPVAPTAKPLRFGGTVVLEGGMAAMGSGAMFVSARRKGQRLPALSRKYDMSDPAWFTQDGNRILRFALTEDDNMAGFGSPLGPEMEVEARYSPSGFIDPKPQADEDGAIRASVPAAPGEANLVVRLRTTTRK